MSQECATGCGRPTGGSALCHGRDDACEERLVQAVAELPALADELDTTATRQAVIGSKNGGGSRSAETPLPWDIRAARAKAELAGHAWRWAIDLWDQTEPLPRGRGLATLGRWLHARINRILDHPNVGDIADSILRATSRAWTAVDRPADKVIVGVCRTAGDDGECGTWLYAHPEANYIRCWSCRSEYDVAASRENLWNDLGNVLMTIAEIISWGERLEYIERGETKRVRNLLDKWVERGRLASHGTNQHGRALYPFGETLTSALSATRKKAA